MQDRTVGGGTAVALSARYTADGERIEKSDPFTGTKVSSFALFDTKTKGGVAEGTLHTPGISFRKGLDVSGGAVGTTGQDRFFHTDQLGSTRHLTDGTGTGTHSTTPSRMRFDAYGLPTQLDGADGWDATEYQYAGAWGYEREPNGSRLGLDYLYQRYYDPAVGKFISADPIGIAGGLNLYAYCENDPVNAVDPSGLQAIPDGSPSDYLHPTNGNGSAALGRWLGDRCRDFLAWANTPEGQQTLVTILTVLDSAVDEYQAAQGMIDDDGPIVLMRVPGSSPPPRGASPSLRAVPGLYGTDQALRRRVGAVPPLTGFFDFAIHGTPAYGSVNRGAAGWTNLDHRSVAAAMKAQGYNGGPVRLLSCSAGAVPDGFAQRLADKLGHDVLAPNLPLGVWPNGRVVIGTGSGHRGDGGWRRFRPRRK